MRVTAAARSSPSPTWSSALLAIEVIVGQGEGISTSAPAPVGFDGTIRPTHLQARALRIPGAPERAHYRRFLDIVESRTPLGAVHPMRLDRRQTICPTASSATYCGVRCLLLAPDERDGAGLGVGDESPLIDSAMVPPANHVEKPIALALLQEAGLTGRRGCPGLVRLGPDATPTTCAGWHGVWARCSTSAPRSRPRPGLRRPSDRPVAVAAAAGRPSDALQSSRSACWTWVEIELDPMEAPLQ